MRYLRYENLMPDYSKLSYTHQLDSKKQRLSALLSTYFDGDLSVYPSKEVNYRMRAEFRVWHEGTDTFHIMFNKQTKEKYRVDTLPAASLIINQAMQITINEILKRPALRTKLFQIDYLSSSSNELVVSLLYHKQLDEQWTEDAKALRVSLSALGISNVIGRARKQKQVVEKDFVMERLLINKQHFSFKQVENSFTQPNAEINVKMIEWVTQNAGNTDIDLLELYCGAGNFSVPLAHHFKRVFATEISKTSVAAAQENIANNNITNLQIARLSSEEFVQAFNKERKFNRLHNINLDEYDFKTVLVDPPRAGLDAETIALVATFDNIIYISCNPVTLADNLKTLNKTHKIQSAALFDQFPFTEHIETGLILSRRA